MITENKYRWLIWLVIILFAMNLATVGSLLFHARKTNIGSASGTENNATEKVGQDQATAAAEQGARFFRDRLGLTPDQMISFREANREYNRKTNWMARDLEALRITLVNEMIKPVPDTVRLNGISQAIGEKHKELKTLTVDYYLSMREVCDEGQKSKLNAIFLDMVQKEKGEPAPRGRRRGWGWNR